eukprot:gene10423-8372_t
MKPYNPSMPLYRFWTIEETLQGVTLYQVLADLAHDQHTLHVAVHAIDESRSAASLSRTTPSAESPPYSCAESPEFGRAAQKLLIKLVEHNKKQKHALRFDRCYNASLDQLKLYIPAALQHLHTTPALCLEQLLPFLSATQELCMESIWQPPAALLAKLDTTLVLAMREAEGLQGTGGAQGAEGAMGVARGLQGGGGAQGAGGAGSEAEGFLGAGGAQGAGGVVSLEGAVDILRMRARLGSAGYAPDPLAAPSPEFCGLCMDLLEKESGEPGNGPVVLQAVTALLEVVTAWEVRHSKCDGFGDSDATTSLSGVSSSCLEAATAAPFCEVQKEGRVPGASTLRGMNKDALFTKLFFALATSDDSVWNSEQFLFR